MNLNRNLVQVLLLLITLVLLQSCTDEEKAIETVFAETERGAVLRTIERVNENFIDGDLTSTFSILIEEQSIETDNQFENVVIFLKHIDRLPNGFGTESTEVVLRNIASDEFFTGSDGLPRLALEITYQEVLELLNLDVNTIDPGDQFELRMVLTLNDGRSFSNDSASSPILTDFCFFKSPYRYVINVIEPIEDFNFTGNYSYEVLDATDQELNLYQLSSVGFTSISNGPTANKRVVGLFLENLEFTIAGPFIYPKLYQAVGGECREAELLYLSTPTESSFGSYDPLDDTVFELDIVLDSEGTTPREARYRFTKQ